MAKYLLPLFWDESKHHHQLRPPIHLRLNPFLHETPSLRRHLLPGPRHKMTLFHIISHRTSRSSRRDERNPILPHSNFSLPVGHSSQSMLWPRLFPSPTPLPSPPHILCARRSYAKSIRPMSGGSTLQYHKANASREMGVVLFVLVFLVSLLHLAHAH